MEGISTFAAKGMINVCAQQFLELPNYMTHDWRHTYTDSMISPRQGVRTTPKSTRTRLPSFTLRTHGKALATLVRNSTVLSYDLLVSMHVSYALCNHYHSHQQLLPRTHCHPIVSKLLLSTPSSSSSSIKLPFSHDAALHHLPILRWDQSASNALVPP